MWRIGIRLAVVSALGIHTSAATAQSGGPYDLAWNTIDSGGATVSSGGAYTIGGTIGQHDAGQLNGQSYLLAGGFWGRVVAGTSPSPTPTPTPPACTGDCGGDVQVTVEDLLTMVNIALGNAPVRDCQRGDASGNNRITVDEILRAVNHGLNGC
ncbi:MAG: hypothetical protein U0587_21165 [Candidatus Binatia bacterium]